MKLKKIFIFVAILYGLLLLITEFNVFADYKKNISDSKPNNSGISSNINKINDNDNPVFHIKNKTYTIQDLGYLTNEEKKLSGSFKVNKDNILFLYDGFMSNSTGAFIYDIKNNTYKEIEDAKGNPSTDYNNAIKLNDNKILLSGHRTGIFNPLTNKIKKNDDYVTGRGFHTVIKDKNHILRFLPYSEPICSGYPGGCIQDKEFIRVLETDLRTGKYEEINKFEINGSLFKRNHITLDDNRVLSYAVGSACFRPDMELYLYNIKENRYTKLKEIKEIGYDTSISSIKLPNGYILFAGGTNECSQEYKNENKKYLDSVIYDPDTNRIIKQVKMQFEPIVGFYSVRLIPLSTGDILVLESGHIRQYFDISSMTFKQLDKEIILNTEGREDILVLDENTIVISHGVTTSKKHAGVDSSTQIYVLKTGEMTNRNNFEPIKEVKTTKPEVPELVVPKNNVKKEITTNNEKVHVVAAYRAKNGNISTHGEGSIDVYVTIKNKPITLLLSAYEPVVWNIKTIPGVRIKKIYISSYYDNKVRGTNAEVEKLPQRISLDEHTYYKIAEDFNKKLETYQYDHNAFKFVVDGNNGKNYKSFVKHKSVGENEPVLLSNNSLIAEYLGYGASSTFSANKYVTKGKYYFEAQIKYGPNAHTTFNNTGIMSDSLRYCSFTHPKDTGECLYAAIGRIKLVNNSIVGIAFDMDNGYLSYSINGVWNDTQVKFRNDGREYSPAFEVMQGSKWIVNFGANNFKYPIPKGYKAFDEFRQTKGYKN